MQGSGIAQPSLAASNAPNNNQESKAMEPSDSLKYAVFLLDKKLRNMEKKKVKIEKYIKDKKQGKELNEDQLQAITRFEETCFAIISTRDMKKQFEDTVDEMFKLQKKQSKKVIYAEKESRRTYLKDILVVKGLVQSIYRYSELQEHFLNQSADDSKKDAILNEIMEIGKELQTAFDNSLDNEDSEIVNRFFCLVEGKAKAISGDCDATYAMAKTSIMKLKDFVKEFVVKNHRRSLPKTSEVLQVQHQVVNRPMPEIQRRYIEEQSIQNLNEKEVVHNLHTMTIASPTISESSNQQKSAQEERTQAAIRSLTFTNRNFATPINDQYSYDQMMYDQQMNMSEANMGSNMQGHDTQQTSMRSPVAFVASGGYDSRQSSHLPVSTPVSADDVGFFIPLGPQFQQQSVRYPQNMYSESHMYNQIPQVQFAPRPQQSSRYQSGAPAGYEQKSYRRERPQRPGNYSRPSGNYRGSQGENQSRRMPYAPRASAQQGSQNY